MEKVFELGHVFKSYNTFRMEDISFHLQTGYIMGLVGHGI